MGRSSTGKKPEPRDAASKSIRPNASAAVFRWIRAPSMAALEIRVADKMGVEANHIDKKFTTSMICDDVMAERQSENAYTSMT